MDVKVTIGFNQETVSLIESFISSFGGAAVKAKRIPASNGAVKTDTAAASTESAKEVVEPVKETTGAEEKVTIEIIRAFIVQHKEKHRDKMKALLEEYNIKSVTSLLPDQYAAFYTKLKALI